MIFLAVSFLCLFVLVDRFHLHRRCCWRPIGSHKTKPALSLASASSGFSSFDDDSLSDGTRDTDFESQSHSSDGSAVSTTDVGAFTSSLWRRHGPTQVAGTASQSTGGDASAPTTPRTLGIAPPSDSPNLAGASPRRGSVSGTSASVAAAATMRRQDRWPAARLDSFLDGPPGEEDEFLTFADSGGMSAPQVHHAPKLR